MYLHLTKQKTNILTIQLLIRSYVRLVGGAETISEQRASLYLRARSFDDLFLETSEEALRQVFGEKVAEVVLQRVLNSSRGDNPDRVKVFSDALSRVLGSGAVAIERLILKHLYRKFALNLEQKYGYYFMDYIEELKRFSITGKEERSNLEYADDLERLLRERMKMRTLAGGRR